MQILGNKFHDARVEFDLAWKYNLVFTNEKLGIWNQQNSLLV